MIVGAGDLLGGGACPVAEDSRQRFDRGVDDGGCGLSGQRLVRGPPPQPVSRGSSLGLEAHHTGKARPGP